MMKMSLLENAPYRKVRFAMLWAIAEELRKSELPHVQLAGRLLGDAATSAHELPIGEQLTDQHKADMREAAHHSATLLEQLGAGMTAGDLLRASFLLNETATIVNSMADTVGMFAAKRVADDTNAFLADMKLPGGMIVLEGGALHEVIVSHRRRIVEGAVESVAGFMAGSEDR